MAHSPCLSRDSRHSYSVGLLIRLSSHDCSCPLAPRKSFDILALYKSDYYYYYYNTVHFWQHKDTHSPWQASTVLPSSSTPRIRSTRCRRALTPCRPRQALYRRRRLTACRRPYTSCARSIQGDCNTCRIWEQCTGVQFQNFYGFLTEIFLQKCKHNTIEIPFILRNFYAKH